VPSTARTALRISDSDTDVGPFCGLANVANVSPFCGLANVRLSARATFGTGVLCRAEAFSSRTSSLVHSGLLEDFLAMLKSVKVANAVCVLTRLKYDTCCREIKRHSCPVALDSHLGSPSIHGQEFFRVHFFRRRSNSFMCHLPPSDNPYHARSWVDEGRHRHVIRPGIDVEHPPA
jgi:hypothetical protein